MPSFAKVRPSFAPSAAMRTSQGRIIVTPTPIAAPFTAAITGFGYASELERELPQEVLLAERRALAEALPPAMVRLQVLEVDARAEAAACAGQDHRAHRVVAARAPRSAATTSSPISVV